MIDTSLQYTQDATGLIVRRIAILSNSALGELLLTLPLIQECRKAYPASKITLVCSRPSVSALARELAIADDIVLLPAKARRSPLALWKSLMLLRNINADILLQAFTSRGTFGNLLAGGSRAKTTCGFSSGRFQRLLTHRIPVDPTCHRITSNLNLLRRLGLTGISAPSGRYLPTIEQKSELYPDGKVGDRYGSYVVISVGSDPLLAFKKWPAKSWTQLCKLLARDGLTTVFVGDGPLRAEIDAIVAGSGSSCVNLAGQTKFGDLAALIKSSALVIGTDGMILHFAASMYKTCVGIFGPTAPLVVGPWGDIHENVYLDLPCSPCYGAHSIGKEAGCATRECLNQLSVILVYKNVKCVLGRSSRH